MCLGDHDIMQMSHAYESCILVMHMSHVYDTIGNRLFVVATILASGAGPCDDACRGAEMTMTSSNDSCT